MICLPKKLTILHYEHNAVIREPKTDKSERIIRVSSGDRCVRETDLYNLSDIRKLYSSQDWVSPRQVLFAHVRRLCAHL